jgi:hypothetical protein
MAVAATSTRSAWAVGWGAGRGAILHWDGASWSRAEDGLMDALYDAQVSDVWANSEDDVWVVGTEDVDLPLGVQTGFVLHWNGSAWSIAHQDISGMYFEHVWGSGPNDIWVTGQSVAGLPAAVGVHFDGQTWAPPVLFGLNVLNDIRGSGPNDIWAVSYPPGRWHFDGQTWTSTQTGGFSQSALAVNSTTIAWSVGAAGTMKRWDGRSWRDESIWLSGINSMRAVSSTEAWAVGGTTFIYQPEVGEILHWADGAWTRSTSVTGSMLYGLFGSKSDLWAVGAAGTMLHGDGHTWTIVPTATSAALLAAHGTGPTDVWAVGQSAVILHYDGSSWQPYSSTVAVNLAGVFALSATEAWAVGDGGTALHFDGHGWISTPSGADGPLSAVWASGGSDVWAAGSTGTLLHFDGKLWRKSALPADRNAMNLYAIYGTSSRDIFLTGDATFHWNGSDWSNVVTGVADTLTTIWVDHRMAWIGGVGGQALMLLR